MDRRRWCLVCLSVGTGGGTVPRLLGGVAVFSPQLSPYLETVLSHLTQSHTAPSGSRTEWQFGRAVPRPGRDDRHAIRAPGLLWHRPRPLLQPRRSPAPSCTGAGLGGSQEISCRCIGEPQRLLPGEVDLRQSGSSVQGRGLAPLVTPRGLARGSVSGR